MKEIVLSAEMRSLFLTTRLKTILKNSIKLFAK